MVIVPSGWTPPGWTIFAGLYLRLALHGDRLRPGALRGADNAVPGWPRITSQVNATAGEPTTVSWNLQAAAYDVAADHRTMLAVNAKDALYSDANPALATLRVGSTAGTEARLDLPLG